MFPTIFDFFHKVFEHLRVIIQKRFLKIRYGKKIILGQNVFWRSNLKVIIKNRKHAKLIIGDYCFFNNYCSLNCLGKIQIGAHTIFGENVKIYDHNHVFNRKDMHVAAQGYNIGSVTIGKNCWIGSNTTLLKGTDIGDNCVIGAGSVISGKIPENSLVTSDRSLKIEPIYFR